MHGDRIQEPKEPQASACATPAHSVTRAILIFPFIVLALPHLVSAEVTVRDPGSYVVDAANIIDPANEQQMNLWLAELEQKTTAQIKVLTVTTIDGEDFFGFVQRHAELWKLGRKGKDNGALIPLAINERKVRIHTGYGLEGMMQDAWCGSVSRVRGWQARDRWIVEPGNDLFVVWLHNWQDTGSELTTLSRSAAIKAVYTHSF